MPDSQYILAQLLIEKRRTDPDGYRKAEQDGDLLIYLRPALLRAGLDPESVILHSDGRLLVRTTNDDNSTSPREASTLRSRASAARTSTTSSSSSAASAVGGGTRRSGTSSSSSSGGSSGAGSNEPLGQLMIYVDMSAQYADEYLFEPIFESSKVENHMNIADALALCRSSPYVDHQLKVVKVACTLGSVVFLGLTLSSISQGNLPKVALSVFLTADLFRVAYNCYLKKYCQSYLVRYFGSTQRLTGSLVRMAQSAVGLADPRADPIVKLKTEVLWDLLFQDTLSRAIYIKGQALIKT